MKCQDCGEREASELVYDREKREFFALCDLCISGDDLIVPLQLINEFMR